MIPSNLKREIKSLEAPPEGHLLFPWSQKRQKFNTKNFDPKTVKNLTKEDIAYVQRKLKKSCKLWNPEMKKFTTCLKLSAWMMFILTVILITILVIFVAPGDLELFPFLVFGMSSTLMVFIILGILGCFLAKADQDFMINREMELKEKVEEMNIENFFSRNIVFKVGRLGSCLIARNAKLKGIGNFYDDSVLPTLANVYDDEGQVYYQAKSKQPFCGPASKFDPLERRMKGKYEIIRRKK